MFVFPQSSTGSPPPQKDEASPERHEQASSSLMTSLTNFLNAPFVTPPSKSVQNLQAEDSTALPSTNARKAEAVMETQISTEESEYSDVFSPGPEELVSPTRARVASMESLMRLARGRKGMHTHRERVHIKKEPEKGMGMTVIGGCDTSLRFVLVTSVDKSGAAFKGGVHTGDEVLEVNGRSLADLTSQEVVNVLRKAPENVELLIGKAGIQGEPDRLPSTIRELPESKSPSREPSTSEPATEVAQVDSDDVPPTLPEISPPHSHPPSLPNSRPPSVVAEITQTSPSQERPKTPVDRDRKNIHRRSLTSIPTAAELGDIEGSESGEDDREVSIVPMQLRVSRKRTRVSRIKSPPLSEDLGSNDSMHASSTSHTPYGSLRRGTSMKDVEHFADSHTGIITPYGSLRRGTTLPQVENVLPPEEDRPVTPISPPPILPSSLSGPASLVDDSVLRESDRVTSHHIDTLPQKLHALSSAGSSSPTLLPNQRAKQTHDSPSVMARSRSVHSASQAKQSPKTSPKSSPRSSPFAKRRSSSRRAPSKDNSVVFGRRSETSAFEIQLRKMVAGLKITTKAGQQGEVLINSPGDKSSDIR